MKIVSRQSSNSKMEIIELIGGLVGSGARELRDWLFSHMDDNRCKNYVIIDLGRVNKIDGIGIYTLESFVSRGLDIRLLNVGPEIRCMLSIAGKRGLYNKIYNETDCDRAAYMLEKEILEKGKVEMGIRMRRYPRVNTFFPVGFKYIPKHYGAVLCKGNVLNLSEGGLYVDEIRVVDFKKKKS